MKRMILFVDGSANDRVSIASTALLCERLAGRLSVVHSRERAIVATSPDTPIHIEGEGRLAGREAVAKPLAFKNRETLKARRGEFVLASKSLTIESVDFSVINVSLYFHEPDG